MTTNGIRVSKCRPALFHGAKTLAVTLALSGVASATAHAEEAIPAVAATATPPTPVAASAPPPPPYSLPWQLRPVTVGTVLRSDTTTALFENAAGETGTTIASMLLGSYKVTPEFAPMVRLGFVNNDNPGAAGVDGSSFVNPIVGATYARKFSSFKWAAFGATTIPIGMGAGNTPNKNAAAANASGIPARSGMDNAMFAVNYMTPIVGGDLAYVNHKFTAQLEATALFLFRVRGDAAASATDSSRVNSTFGLHLGYFIIPQLSVGGELRYQRWLTTPTTKNAAGAVVNIPDVNKDTLTLAIGPRANFKLTNTMWIRPGISYSRGLDEPLSKSTMARNGNYNMIQVDVPVIF